MNPALNGFVITQTTSQRCYNNIKYILRRTNIYIWHYSYLTSTIAAQLYNALTFW